MPSQQSELTTVQSAIEAILADNALPTGQQRGLMLLPAYAEGLPTFAGLWHRFYGPGHDFQETPNCRSRQLTRLGKLNHRLSH